MENENLEVAFVCDLFNWDAVNNDESLPDEVKAKNLDDFEKYNADLIVEAAHPDVSKNFGVRFLKSADYMIASTTTFPRSLFQPFFFSA